MGGCSRLAGVAVAAALVAAAAPAEAGRPIISSFIARFDGRHVVVSWRARAPAVARTARFQLDRANASPGARRTRVVSLAATGPRAYRVVDRAAPLRAVVRYWLTTIGTDGARAVYGPVSTIT